MSFYRERVLPYVIHWSMRQATVIPYRHRVIAKAGGRTLEVGFGSGLNLPFYTSDVARVIGLEPSPKLLSMAPSENRDSGGRHKPLVPGMELALPSFESQTPRFATRWFPTGLYQALV